MPTETYESTRSEVLSYFDETAHHWEAMTSESPAKTLQNSVRVGRNEMRDEILNRLPDSLSGQRVLDAGCGTGLMLVELARRNASVTAADISPRMIEIAQRRCGNQPHEDKINFVIGDMLSSELGHFDYIIAMDSLIHYAAQDLVTILIDFTKRTKKAIHFTITPRQPNASFKNLPGRWLPQEERIPTIEPIMSSRLTTLLSVHPALRGWTVGASLQIKSGFYVSEAISLYKSQENGANGDYRE